MNSEFCTCSAVHKKGSPGRGARKSLVEASDTAWSLSISAHLLAILSSRYYLILQLPSCECERIQNASKSRLRKVLQDSGTENLIDLIISQKNHAEKAIVQYMST